MPLSKFKIDQAIAKNQYYLVGGNRVHLAEVDSDLVAEKLFKAGVAGVSQVEVVQPVADLPAEIPADTPTDLPAKAKK